MDKQIDFVIPSPPKGKARARTLKNGITYTPKETVQYENLVKICCRESIGHQKPYLYPVHMEIRAHFPIPKSSSNKRQQMMLSGEILPATKPDADNIAKSVCDALNGIAYRDDSQIVVLHVSKYYSDQPRVEVIIGEMGGS